MKGRMTIYWRGHGRRRWYGDFREYADVGGKREALVPEGKTQATDDPALAEALYAKRLADLQQRRLRVAHGLPQPMSLAACAKDYLVAKEGEVNAKTGEPITDQWLEGEQMRLGRALDFFGVERELAGVTVEDARRWNARLAEQGLAGGTRRHHLNTLGALYRYAGERALVAPGFNPIALWRKKPTARRDVEARWLEVPDAALLLEAARLYRPAQPKGGRQPVPFGYELLATFLLTGGRESEVLGLETDDVSLERGQVTFRPNEWRRLKTATSFRSVTLWPQLREVLRDYFPRRERHPGTLLFPSYRTGTEAMLTDFRALLDAVAARAGWKPGEIRSKMFRHTYCAARLQTLDAGAAVSPYTVAREMGHGGVALVNRVYGHLGTVRHRAEAVEYRVEQHAAKLGQRLEAVQRASLAPLAAQNG